jgi:hypothetical protein
VAAPGAPAALARTKGLGRAPTTKPGALRSPLSILTGIVKRPVHTQAIEPGSDRTVWRQIWVEDVV